MNKYATLIAVLLLGAWLAQPAESGGRAGATYRFRTPPAFDSTEDAQAWLDVQGQNGYVLRTEVVLRRDEGGKLRLVPTASLASAAALEHLMFQSGGLRTGTSGN